MTGPLPLTPERVLKAVTGEPAKVGDLGLRLLRATAPEGMPIGQFLATQGLSLSALQSAIDELVRNGQVRELRGRALWDEYFPGLGANAKGRFYVLP